MSVRKNRIMLIAIFALFFTPVLLAVLMQSRWWQFTPERTVNRGDLVEPPVTLALLAPDSAAAGTWSMLYPFSGQCGNGCEDDVTGLRQIHRAAGRRRDQLTVVLLGLDGIDPATRGRLRDIYPEFRLLEDPEGRGRQALDQTLARLGDAAGGAAGRGFVVDPAGNLILAYPRHFDPSDMNKDLQRLLKGAERWEGERRPGPETPAATGGEPAA